MHFKSWSKLDTVVFLDVVMFWEFTSQDWHWLTGFLEVGLGQVTILNKLMNWVCIVACTFPVIGEKGSELEIFWHLISIGKVLDSMYLLNICICLFWLIKRFISIPNSLWMDQTLPEKLLLEFWSWKGKTGRKGRVGNPCQNCEVGKIPWFFSCSSSKAFSLTLVSFPLSYWPDGLTL